MIANLWRRLLPWLRPFRGWDVRRMAAAFTLAVAIPRLPFWPTQPTVNPLRFLPPEAFGWLCLVVGIALVITAGRRRCRVSGRLVALAGLVLWGLLAGATNSATSFWVDITIAYAMLGEIGAGCNEDRP